MNKCKTCNKETKNKVYCSTECQYSGYKVKKVNRVITNCIFCSGKFETLPNKLENGKSKYCSRVCKDSHQKQLYSNDGNPLYGKKVSEESKKMKSEMMTELWKSDSHKEKVRNGKERFFEENGFWCGSDEDSINKRKKTMLERYGVDNISKLPETINKRDKTCLEKYGKTSIEILKHYSWGGKDTRIELKISKILIENDIKFETQYDIYYDENKFKSYDFYLPKYNLLIEADGDYWHGNPIKFNKESLNEVQLKNIENDNLKNKIASENSYNLVRFWECDIMRKGFKYKLFNVLKEYGKKED
jgi:G:T-mismatch repair DNA endonuclease (very short patch repair protein)